MSDIMVLKTQQWLNTTYGGMTGYTLIPENGNTGWTTIYALLHALQIELGITATADNFGPSTISRFNNRFPNGIQEQNYPSSYEDNIYGIIQGALWCKGYSTGASSITKHFYGGTGGAVEELKYDAGCTDTSSTVTLNVMKALMSMTQFKLVNGGNTSIRQAQREMNSGYEAYIGLSPCDGVYGREMNKSMIKVLQAIEGYSVEDATGNFGAGTKANLPIVPSAGQISEETEKKAIKLVRYSLVCNGYDVSVDSNQWDTLLSDVIEEFQGDLCLQETRICDTDTWMSLLLSKGNPDRSCVACDTRFEMTNLRLNYLNSNNYEIVGRYLTGTEFKVIREKELERIINAGLEVALLFQESTDDVSYFTNNRGKTDAINAVNAARTFGVPGGNVIYFAVDFDPTDTQITQYILPYFKGISDNISTSYKVGVYGTRNVCTRVMNMNYAETCYVSDMSTGYSGNMGYKIPDNWNFDQFSEISNIDTGDFENMDIDKVAYSGKYNNVSYVYREIQSYLSDIIQLENLYAQYKTSISETYTAKDIVFGITNFFRSFSYKDYKWFVGTLNPIDNSFIQYVISNNLDLYNRLYDYAYKSGTHNKALRDNVGGYIDIGHFAATVEGYMCSSIIPKYWFGWAGDLATLMSDVDDERQTSLLSYIELARRMLGDSSSFPFDDLCTDADAISISSTLNSLDLENLTTTHELSNAMYSYYYYNYSASRKDYYCIDLINTTDVDVLKNSILSIIQSGFTNTTILNILGSVPSTYSKDACCQALAEYILS